MARFCHFWRLTPDQYRDLTVAEFDAMAQVMEEAATDGE